jgi:hypothetical protein
MDWNRVGAVGSTIGGIFATLTFGIAIWPWPQIKASQGTPAGISFSPKLIAIFLLISFVLSATSIYGAWRRRPSPLGNKLMIHSAVYGTGPIDDMVVTHNLRTAVRDALVVPVDNNLVPRDPAIGKVKRLAVEYSYGNPSIQQASRLEGERLVLPEDSEIQQLRGEVEQLKNTKAAIPDNYTALQQSESLRALPVYFQDLEVKLLAGGTGSTLDFSKTTLFLKLSFTSDDDTGLRDMKVCFSVHNRDYVETPLDDLSDWILQTPFENAQNPYKTIEEKPLGTVSLWRDIQRTGLKAGLMKTGWVGIRIPNAKLPDEEVRKVKIEVTKPQPRRAYRFYFSAFPETHERVIDADFRRPS